MRHHLAKLMLVLFAAGQSAAVGPGAPAGRSRPPAANLPVARVLNDDPLQALADIHTLFNDRQARLDRLRDLADASGDLQRRVEIDRLTERLTANHARRLEELRRMDGPGLDRCEQLLNLRLAAEEPLAHELPANRSLVVKVRRLRLEVVRRMEVRRQRELARQRAERAEGDRGAAPPQSSPPGAASETGGRP